MSNYVQRCFRAGNKIDFMVDDLKVWKASVPESQAWVRDKEAEPCSNVCEKFKAIYNILGH